MFYGTENRFEKIMIFQNSGIFIINKPYQWTSNDVIRKIKSNYKFKKIGHAGTLDPLATGILPILVNDSTKYFDYFQSLLNLIWLINLDIEFTDTRNITN